MSDAYIADCVLQIGEMAEHWVKYVRRFDRLIEDALRLAIKATMQNMYKCVHGDGTMAPSPLIKMNLYLSDKNIIYLPTKNEISDTFTTVLDEIVHILSTMPRLFQKFGLPAGGLKNFTEVIQTDADTNKLQSLIDSEIEYNLGLIREHMRMWDPYAHIWKIDKDEFMEKYRQEGHTAADFDELIINYSDLANAVQIQETFNQIHFITLNSSELKKSIIAHCSVWQTKLGQLLRTITECDIDVVYAYIERSSVEAMTMPADLKELATAIATYERLIAEISPFEKTFPPITDQMSTLVKFEVELSSDMVARHENIPVVWTEYLNLLEEAKKALELNKDKFKAELLEQAEVFKEAAKEFCDDFYKTAPCSSDVSGKDAMTQLKAFREQLNALRAQEQQIKDGLAVFNLTTPVNLDLQRMEKELEKLEEVWGLVFQWEESWEKYKTQTFWEMETDEMEENVMYLFRNFNRLSRQLKDKGWDIIDTTRVKVDAFRRTLPLIGDLKNPCMRERHWDRIKTLMGVEFDQDSEDFKLEVIMRLNFQAYAEDIAEISNAATMELNIENGLKAIREVWKNTTYEMQHHRGDMYKIKNVEDVMQFLEDHQVQLSSMKSTKYVEPFIKEVDYWEKSLGYVAECIEISLQVQRRYLYLESIFSGEDIRKQLPNEVKIFDALCADWTEITSNSKSVTKILDEDVNKPNEHVRDITATEEQSPEGDFQCFYMSKKSIQKAMSFLTPVSDGYLKARTCRQNLVEKQTSQYVIKSYIAHRYCGSYHWRTRYLMAMNRAIYSHDWNKLLYILKKSPINEHTDERTEFHYIRALTILLMNHPSAKSQSLLNDYLHMVLSCRSDQDKKALFKVLLTMPQTLIGPSYRECLAKERDNQAEDL
ncbi:unnamed protein product [Leptosia nina]|uniref:Uncharacterized protein n=1 Tax=Leptosia nina TaxID=320188 RepID=A0AAV1IXE2_9NEOP